MTRSRTLVIVWRDGVYVDNLPVDLHTVIGPKTVHLHISGQLTKQRIADKIVGELDRLSDEAELETGITSRNSRRRLVGTSV